jgi:hypothetical protein
MILSYPFATCEIKEMHPFIYFYVILRHVLINVDGTWIEDVPSVILGDNDMRTFHIFFQESLGECEGFIS